ncbi:sigma-54 interaction domain-containing protein [Methylomagnum ishizawai]|uniref:sigma-54 interaction domain-containing protein n=1 Tax=Methylomagnum ishizawai TaxID=1760988 RepID=UPI001C32A256|nr:sigma-54 dependent transcriptional regulator [Methylomagnum ishizawai]BBL74913.1 transcriptional regulator [Methylomagnum ishizawai]
MDTLATDTFSTPITEALFHEFRSAVGHDRAPPVLTFPEPRALSLSIRATALVFEDPRSQALFARLERIAPSEASVLVIGETGTGKELVARQVHALSRRAGGPFVAVNCAALPETLIESELFGHEKGAFTGAVQAKSGWFETAHGGTLFLDEIGDLPLGVQVKLLRVLQEREIVRVGSRQPTPIDVRLIAATNVNLEQAVRAGTFREDLFYRLNVAPLDLPPLRERPGDILPLVLHFLRVYAERLGRSGVSLTQEAARRLQEYEWPGNIRELENVIHHALLVCAGSALKPTDLHFSSTSFQRPATLAEPQADSGELRRVLFRLFEQAPPNLMETIQETLIRSAYDYCEHNQVHTARLLDISRNILRARLARYGLIGVAEKAEPVEV